ncbi:hypothetical protein GPECTOR_200g360 [Gonium pectorale]|uniref:Endoplasmic reticulum resident protein 29 C-terminal domain-containing protein n=1 Tax=Gonium pectorale TaxID=33097 RepID=A0A150FWY2_GONPE|nr:hypothetical protein GPECTOR_200g360 [Gonium pectorale]|eukprot:KXZ42122.1 hypothetical protein GPECTOR_200g360 [Gonium pectorale]
MSVVHDAHGFANWPLRSQGILFLDKYTFDKIVDGTRDVFVSFNKEYAWGDDYTAFKHLAKAVGEAKDPLLVAGVQVAKRDYDPKNIELAARFKADDEKKFPIYMLFRKGVGSHGQPLRYPDEASKKTTDLLAWLAQHTGGFYGLKGQIKELDALAKELMAAADEAGRQAALSKAEQEAAALPEGTEKAENGQYYVKVMRKAVTNPGYPAAEAKRLNGVMAGKLTDAKRTAMQTKLNVLSSFLGGSSEEEAAPADAKGAEL